MTILGDDPLVELGVADVRRYFPSMSADEIPFVRVTLRHYLSSEITRFAAAAAHPGLPHALDQIDQILRTPANPIPSIPGNQGGHARNRAKLRRWSSYEDQRLFFAIHHFGPNDWTQVASFVGSNRTKSQCYQRWTRSLDPTISKLKWTPESEHHLLVLVARYGDSSWSKVSAELGDRCDIQCRYKYQQLKRDPNFGLKWARAHEAAARLNQDRTEDPQQMRGFHVMAMPPQVTFTYAPAPYPVQLIPYPQPVQIIQGSAFPLVPQSQSGIVVLHSEPRFPAQLYPSDSRIWGRQ
jgi:hypothetical protein